jgi:hypothetical protein
MPVWNVQPVFATRGIVSSAVTEGLVLAAYPLPGGVFYDAISGALAAEVSGGAFGPTVANYYFNNGGTARPSGQARGTETATTIFSGQAFPVQATGADFLTTQGTLLALGSVAASATATQYHWIFGSHEYTAIGTGPMVGIDDNQFAGPGRIILGMANGATSPSGNSITNNALTSDPKGKLHFFGAGWDGTNAHWYSQGNGLDRTDTAFSSTIAQLNANRRTWIGRNAYTGAQPGAGTQNVCALALAWNRVLSVQEYAALWANPWQVFSQVSRQRIFIAAGPVVASPQYARAASDVASQWYPSVDGATLAAEVDESTAVDTDFIVALDESRMAELTLSSVTDPLSSAGHVVRYRAYADQAVSIQVSLFQATTKIATWTEALTATTTLYTHTLSSTQTDSITDYSALRLRFNTLPT